ncbi:hypothetical protein RE474_13555 [Methanolobus sediminis]|uniref:Uncharacterized protein n=1 Tax=Methanolobus sediminis TaxID=3072978 RepID=A0AA51UK81_9EURY|nr:hypothetical protein [Methanolobus sediminis]WMW25089.1 hypothetical protein RE474_13555 [Methanolobus sediminis]
MNEQLHTDCSILQKKLPTVLPVSTISSMKVNEPDLFNQIIQRYSIGTKQGNFPSLIFLRLLETVDGTIKLTNINQDIIKKILSTSIIQYLNLHLTSWPAQNVVTHESEFKNQLSSGKNVLEQQMNIQTGSGEDKKHPVTPRLMRYLKLVDRQTPNLIFEPVSVKTQETMELVRTLSEKTLSQREKMKNPLILSNNLSKKSIFLKTQSDKIQLENTGDLLKLQHLKTPDISSFDEYTKQVLAGVKVDENTKAKDIILHSSTHADEAVLKIDTLVARVQKRNELVYEKYENFSRRTEERYLMTEKKNIANRSVSNKHIARLRIADMEAEDGEVPTSPNLLSNQGDLSLHHARNAQTDINVPFDLSSSNISRIPSDLVLRKSAVQNSDEEPDNKVKSDAITTGIDKTDSEKAAVVEKNVKSLNSVENIDNITIIADRVYKLLESKLSIEKERRGLR